jgi:menaquinone-dependent protoporphyrinogen oxidase
MDKVLVAYASKYGATAEIAASIGSVLQSNGLDVVVQSVDTIRDVKPYQAVVLGSGVYAGNWLAPAVEFIESQAGSLAERPLWLFSSGPTGEGDPQELLGGWQFPATIEAVVDKLGPRGIKVFHGKIDLDRLHWGERLLVRAMRGATGDWRDWDNIHAWAESIAAALKAG